MSDDIWMTCKDYKFIDQGHLKHQRYASALQRAQPSTGYFVETLVGGLQRLENLSRVILDDWWSPYRRVLNATENLIPRKPAGSPLARKWNILHTYPQDWEWKRQYWPPELGRGATARADHYWAITCALVRSQRQMHTLKVGPTVSQGIPAYVCLRQKPVEQPQLSWSRY